MDKTEAGQKIELEKIRLNKEIDAYNMNIASRQARLKRLNEITEYVDAIHLVHMYLSDGVHTDMGVKYIKVPSNLFTTHKELMKAKYAISHLEEITENELIEINITVI